MESVREKRLSVVSGRWSVVKPDYPAQAVDSGLAFTTGGNNDGWMVEAGGYCYHDDDQVVETTWDAIPGMAYFISPRFVPSAVN